MRDRSETHFEFHESDGSLREIKVLDSDLICIAGEALVYRTKSYFRGKLTTVIIKYFYAYDGCKKQANKWQKLREKKFRVTDFCLPEKDGKRLISPDLDQDKKFTVSANNRLESVSHITPLKDRSTLELAIKQITLMVKSAIVENIDLPSDSYFFSFGTNPHESVDIIIGDLGRVGFEQVGIMSLNAAAEALNSIIANYFIDQSLSESVENWRSNFWKNLPDDIRSHL